jgi:hypothetical protein
MKIRNLNSLFHKALTIALFIPFLAVSQNNNNGQGNQNATNKLHPIGNVGIGTANPNSDVNLEIIGRSRMIGVLEVKERVLFDKDLLLNQYADTVANIGRILYLDKDGRLRAGREFDVDEIRREFDIEPGGEIIIRQKKCNPILPWTKALQTNAISLCPDYNLVGIGTNNPQGRLHVQGNTIIGGGGRLGVGTSNPLSALHVNGESFFNGKVGIGTSYIPSNFQMAVNGSILAVEFEVLVRNTWPDFVFNEDYELPSLAQTEKFVKENKHLPGIPSEKDVLENGLKLAETNAALLKVIEELYLYTFQLNKRITELEEVINH